MSRVRSPGLKHISSETEITISSLRLYPEFLWDARSIRRTCRNRRKGKAGHATGGNGRSTYRHLATDIAFERLGLSEIRSTTVYTNREVRSLHRKSGFKEAGVTPGAQIIGGRPVDFVHLC